MKRLYIYCIFMLLFLYVPHLSAQSRMKIGILELMNGTGIDKAAIKGLEDILISQLQSTGKFTIVERSRVNALVKELQVRQGSNLTRSQLRAFSQRLGVDAVLLGTVNNISSGSEYNIDLRLVSVQDGSTIAAAGATKNARESKRQLMNRISMDLANQVSTSASQPVLLHGYLTVYPYDLGKFYVKPTEILSMINRRAEYGYNDWRLPTDQELALMKSNRPITGIVPNVKYATSSSTFGGYEYTFRPVRSVKGAVVSEDQVVLSPESYDFGNIPVFKTHNETTFTIKNNSSSYVDIESINCSMSNVKAIASRTRIAPKDISTVRVVLDTKGRQGMSITRKIHVLLSNGQTLTFELTGKVL